MLASGYVARSPAVVLWLGTLFLAFGVAFSAITLKRSQGLPAQKA